MLVIDRIEGHIAIIKGKGSTIEIPRRYFPNNAKEGDVIKIIVDEVAKGKRMKDVDKLADDSFE